MQPRACTAAGVAAFAGVLAVALLVTTAPVGEQGVRLRGISLFGEAPIPFAPDSLPATATAPASAIDPVSRGKMMRIQAAIRALTSKIDSFNDDRKKYATNVQASLTKAKGALSQIRGEFLAADDLDLDVYRKVHTPGPRGEVAIPTVFLGVLEVCHAHNTPHLRAITRPALWKSAVSPFAPRERKENPDTRRYLTGRTGGTTWA